MARNVQINTGSNITARYTHARRHEHTHTHTLQNNTDEGLCCLTNIPGEEKCLRFAFERCLGGHCSGRGDQSVRKCESHVWVLILCVLVWNKCLNVSALPLKTRFWGQGAFLGGIHNRHCMFLGGVRVKGCCTILYCNECDLRWHPRHNDTNVARGYRPTSPREIARSSIQLTGGQQPPAH